MALNVAQNDGLKKLIAELGVKTLVDAHKELAAAKAEVDKHRESVPGGKGYYVDPVVALPMEQWARYVYLLELREGVQTYASSPEQAKQRKREADGARYMMRDLPSAFVE